LTTEPKPIFIAQPELGPQELDAVAEVLASGWLTQGPKVAAFEQAFAQTHGVGNAVATTSCTTAMHLVLSALDVGPGIA
jgi:perosamine synthetase